jgi:hypothetical protein
VKGQPPFVLHQDRHMYTPIARDPRGPGPRTAGFRAGTRPLGGPAIDGEGMI